MARRTIALPDEPIELDPPGTVIAEGRVDGRAVPWQAPTVGRNGGCVPTRSYKRYQQWQALVRHLAAIQRPRRKRWPYRGEVELRLVFYLNRRGGRSNPDLSNVVKAFEDSLQGAVFDNDTQVCKIKAERVYTSMEPERVEYAVVAL